MAVTARCGFVTNHHSSSTEIVAAEPMCRPADQHYGLARERI